MNFSKIPYFFYGFLLMFIVAIKYDYNFDNYLSAFLRFWNNLC